jgi:hypothetical protein
MSKEFECPVKDLEYKNKCYKCPQWIVGNGCKLAIEFNRKNFEKISDLGLCPRCKHDLGKIPAISRLDNKTNICSQCGQEEAMFDYSISQLNDKDKKAQRILAGLWLPTEIYQEYLKNI